jgi:hypothetical protein
MKQFLQILVIGLVLAGSDRAKLQAQSCINSSQYPSGTVTVASSGTTAITSCNYAGEFSVENFTAAGFYYFSSTGGASNYITVTDASNNPVGAGYAPLGVVIPSVGVYNTHISLNPACGTDGSCHNVSIYSGTFCANSSQYPSSTVNIATSGTTQVTSCNYGGEFSVNSFSAAGIYTIVGTGGTGNYFTVMNSANTVIYASGTSPLSVNIPTTGIYQIHITTSGPGSCGTDATCHTVEVVAPGPPPAPPANDLCSGAILMATNSSTAGTTVNATTESPSPGTCNTTLSQPGVWYMVAGTGNPMGAGLCATSSWDSKIFVYSGSCGVFTCVKGNDDNGPMCSGAAASVTWCSVPTLTYYILVTGYSSASAFNISVTETVVSTPVLTVSASSSSVCPGKTTTLTATGATTYTWSSGQTAATATVAPSSTATYTISGREATGCKTGTNTIQITTLPLPTITVNSGSICPGTVFTITPSGASTYTYSGGSNTVSPIVNTNYSVTGTGTNGCVSASAAVSSIVMFQTPTITVVPASTAICAGNTTTLTASGANTYTWSPSTVSSSLVVTPASTSVYTVSGTGTNVCNGVKTVTVTVNPLPTVSVNSGTVCAGNVFTLAPTGAATYSYTGGSNTVIPTTNTSYSVTGYSSQGCVSAAPAVASVSVVALPVVSVISGTMCEGSQFVILASGASNYTFSGGNPVNPAATTSYSVTGTNSTGCISLPAVATVTVYNNPAVTAASSASVSCSGSPLNLTASGATSYTWSTGANTASTTASPTVNTTYYVIGADTNGCISYVTIPVTVNPVPNVAIATTKTFICVGNTATLTASGALTYTWDNTSTSNTIAVSPSVTTTYSVTGTNTFGCTKMVTRAVNVNSLTLSTSGNTAICAGDNANLSASGVNSYTWSNNSPFPSIVVSPSVTTTYTVNATGNGCPFSQVVMVTVNPRPTVVASITNTMICVGESATLSATGASNYTWSAGSGTGPSVVVSPTINLTFNYSAVGVDANGCSNTSNSVSLVVDKCTGLNEAARGALAVNVYPNPTTGDFVVELANSMSKSILVTDISGRVILSETTSADKTSFSLNHFAAGVYYVKISSGINAEVIKVVKQN